MNIDPKMMKMAMMVLMLISLAFVYQGISMHAKVAVEEANFHALQDSYFSLDKATRDSAATDSDLSDQLVRIHNYPSELMMLKLVGVGKLLTGIYIALFAILMALMMMPVRLGNIIKK